MEVVKTGSREAWCANNIYDLTGNVREWTQEVYEGSHHVVRGGDFISEESPAAVRYFEGLNIIFIDESTGFRATLYIK